MRYGEGIYHHGINYPYGDHFHLINSHPLYVHMGRLLQPFFPIEDYGVAIINGTMLGSMIIGAIAIYLVLRELKLKSWYAILLAIVIQILYPQMARISGHFEMVFAPAFPLFFYFILRFTRAENKLPWAIAATIWGGLCGLIGAYLVALCSVFTLSLILVEAIVHRNNLREYLHRGLYLLAIAALPLIFMKGYTDLTDIVIDRPNNPSGFFEYNANPVSIFLPPTSTLRTILLPRMYDYAMEGEAFVGLPATILVLVILLYVLFNFITQKKLVIQPFNTNKQLWYYLLASFIVLLFSMSWPFDWGLQWIPDKITILKQFRALGRFSWVFYYVISFYTAYMIYYFFNELKNRKLHFVALAFLVFTLAHWTFDGIVNLKTGYDRKLVENKHLNYKNDQVVNQRFTDNGYDPSDFQGILALPYAQTNGDKMLFHKGEWFWRYALECAFHTSVPIIQSYSPRLSFSAAHSTIQLLGDACVEKVRLHDMDDRPILLIVDKSNLRNPEKEIVKKAKLFFEKGNLQYYELNVQKLKDEYNACVSRYQAMLNRNISVSDSSKQYIFESFDDVVNDAPATHSGDGAFYITKGDEKIMSINLSDQGFSDQVEISFWMYFDTRKSSMPGGFVDIYDSNGKLLSSNYTYPRESHNVVDRWVRNTFNTKVKPGLTYVIRVDGEHVTIDDILIKEVDNDILIKQNNLNLFNNYPFKE